MLIVLLEDRLVVDRPSGDLRRPARFSVEWDRLTRLKGTCGIPGVRASMRYFRSHGRFLGFVVYPGANVGPQARREALRTMDSLRVSP